jgi:nucleotidyltransferase/DNA polymerase involved in DNA repair
LYCRIVSVSAEAKAFEITRETRLADAQRICPDLIIIQKKNRFMKPDSRQLREAHYRFRDAILQFVKEHLTHIQHSHNINVSVEISGSDEFFLDLTNFVNVLTIDESNFSQIEPSYKVIVEGRKFFNICSQTVIFIHFRNLKY